MSAAREHYEKYKAKAEALGLAELAKLVPASEERIRAALAAGDEHLNSIPMASWDKAAGIVSIFAANPHCKSCRCFVGTVGRTVGNDPRMAIEGVWADAWRPYERDGKKLRAYWSVAERVCILKWVARHVIAGLAEPA